MPENAPDHPAAPEQRTITAEVEDVRAEGRTLAGFAALYGHESRDLGGYTETIAPGAFADVLAGQPDVFLTINHAPDKVLARTTSGTLRLRDEARGLAFEAELGDGPTAQDVREMVRRQDVRGASFRFKVAPGGERWQGERRTLTRIGELIDVSLATTPAYEGPRVELRSAPEAEDTNTPAPAGSTAEEATEMDTTTEIRDEATQDAEERQEATEERAGTLRVEDRAAGNGGGSLADEFRSRGFPGETATISFGEFRDVTLASGTTSDQLNVAQLPGTPLGADTRWAYTAFPSVPVDAGVTSVTVLRQKARTLAAAADMQRAIDATTAKPETSSEIEVEPAALKQIATVSKGIPNVYLASALVNSIVETDLRLAVGRALDDLVLDALAAAGFEAPASDPLPAIRAAITTIRAAGYSPDVLILDPATEAALDTLVATTGTSDYVFGPGSPAGSIFGLRKHVSTAAAAPVVADAAAVGRLYASPVSLTRFEENDGSTNSSLVRMELHALFGVERIAAAVRIAAA